MEIDWTLVVLIGILVCVGFLVWFIISWEELTRRNFQTVLHEIEKIKRKL